MEDIHLVDGVNNEMILTKVNQFESNTKVILTKVMKNAEEEGELDRRRYTNTYS